MKPIALFAIVLVQGSLAFPQNVQDTELRKSSRPAKLSTGPVHKAATSQRATVALKTHSSSANELAKMEQHSVKSLHQSPQHPAGSTALPKSGIPPQKGNKKIKLSYKPPRSGSAGTHRGVKAAPKLR